MSSASSARRLLSLTAGAVLTAGALLAIPTSASAAANSRLPTATTWGAWKGCGSSYPAGSNCAEIFTTAENPYSHMLWAAGDFTHARNSQNGTMVRYSNLMEIHTSTGALNTRWPSHSFNGTIYAAAVDVAADTLYVGGNFTTVDGSATGAKHVAAFDMSTGARKTGFDVSADNSVRALVFDGRTNLLYLGGRFTAVQGIARTRLAAVNPITGTLSRSFVPPSIKWTETSATQLADVRTLATGANQNGTPMLYVGGHFDTVNGHTYQSVIRVNLATGGLGPDFRPQLFLQGGDNLQEVLKIVYLDPAHGYFGGIVVAQAGHINRAYRFDLDDSTRWTLRANGDFQAAAVRGSTLYLGGHFTCVDPGAACVPGASGGYTRVHLAAANVATGRVDSTFGPRLSPTSKPYYWGVWTLRVASGGTLWAGGDFRLVKTGAGTFVRPKLAGFPPQ